MSAELGAFDAGADELPAPPRWARDTCPAFFKDEFWKGKSDCSSGFWLEPVLGSAAMQLREHGYLVAEVSDLLRMTQTALTSQKRRAARTKASSPPLSRAASLETRASRSTTAPSS